MQPILTYARQQRLVLEEWGFGARMTYGDTRRSLGGRDRYGQTEENPRQELFDEAERAQAAVLCDEADSRFAERTSVESSNDRYANQNVNFLLQRMEDYSGISILTTNFESSTDEALRRRLRFSVRFPEPSVEERALLWSAFIPRRARDHVDPDIDFHRLATRFDITGGYIRNAVLRGAMMAASHGRRLDDDHQAAAAAAVCEELGRLVKLR